MRLRVACALWVAFSGCSGGDGASELSATAHEGRITYLATCVACHNRDPRRPGSLGPEIAGASRELLEAKVLRGVYPQGSTPKSQSRAMVPLPHLAEKIDALAAYLAESAPRPEAAPRASPEAS